MIRFIFIVLLLVINVALADKILVVLPVPSKSHHILGEALAIALSKKGHELTVITAFPSGKHITNYTEVYYDGPVEFKEREAQDMMSYNATFWRMVSSVGRIQKVLQAGMRSKALNNLIHSNATFDLVIYDIMINDAMVALGYRFKAPVIGLNSMGATEILNLIVGNSAPPSYVPSFLLPISDEMTFFQRVLNSLVSPLMGPAFRLAFFYEQDRLLHEIIPDAPPLLDLISNISLIFCNAHYTWESPRPYLPNMIQIGGLHIVDEVLPQDLKTFMDEAKEGVVLFSLGSNLKVSELPPERLNAILKTVSKFPQRFLWKFEDDSLAVPKNVKILKWIPQRGVLAHSNTKALITHGGLLSVIEAIHFGIPFVGIPGFGDQHSNVAQAVRKEYGLKLDLNELNEETFTGVLNEILQNTKYTRNIKKLSTLLRDQPLTPMETAIYWVEHVLKHKGAIHLRNAGVKLSWYQSYLIDVIAFLSCIVAAILWVNYYILKKLFKIVKSKILVFKSSKVKIN